MVIHVFVVTMVYHHMFQVQATELMHLSLYYLAAGYFMTSVSPCMCDTYREENN